MRLGELCGLPWRGVDLEHDYISVFQELYKRGGVCTIKEVKTRQSRRRISLSPDPADPVNSGEPLKTMARRVPPSFESFILLIMCSRNNSDPSLMRGNPAPKRPPKPCCSFSRLMKSAYGFHSTPKGGLANM